MMTNTYYICYRYLMMIDIPKSDAPYVDILKIFENDKSHQWMIYKYLVNFQIDMSKVFNKKGYSLMK